MWEPKTAQPDTGWVPKTAQPDSAASPQADEPHPTALMRGAAERMLGVEELINNAGIGKHIGLAPNDMIESAEQTLKQQGSGTGIGGVLGELAGDPLSYIGGAELKGAQGALGLAKAGGKYGAIAGGTETGAKNIKENLQNAAVGAGAGAALTAGVPAAAKGIKKGVGTLMEGYSARTPEQLQEAASQIREESNAAYKKMREANSYITPQATERLKTEVGKSLSENGILNKELHRGTISVLQQADKAAKSGMSVEVLDQYRRLLSGVINNTPKSEDAKMARTAIQTIDEAVDGLKPADFSNNSDEAVKALNEARSTWAKARKFEVVSDLLEKSGNDPNRRKVLLEQLANNKNKTRGWSNAEVKALKDAAANNTAEGLLKLAGKFGITIGNTRAAGTGNALPAIELMVAGAKKGLPVIAGATGAKHLQNIVGKAKAERLLKEIEKGGIRAPSAPQDPQALMSIGNDAARKIGGY